MSITSRRRPVVVAAFTLALLLPPEWSACSEPRREAGLSVHMLPERVAALQHKHGGFSVTEPRTGKALEALGTAAELVSYVQALPAAVRENGIWLVTTDPDAYSQAEQRNLQSLVPLCAKAQIPLFICRARDLPSGWQRAK